jgi:hypothetical protein
MDWSIGWPPFPPTGERRVNHTLEGLARVSIDRLLEAAGWHVRYSALPTLGAAQGLVSAAELRRHGSIPGRLGEQAPPIVRSFLTGAGTSQAGWGTSRPVQSPLHHIAGADLERRAA